MRFILFKSLNGVQYYGRIPECPVPADDTVDVFYLEESDLTFLMGELEEPVNKLCGTLLGIGDVDFFDASQSKLLAGWLEEREKEHLSGRQRLVYGTLLKYSREAERLGTGVVVEL